MKFLLLSLVIASVLVMAGCSNQAALATGTVVDQAGKKVKEARVVFQSGDLYLVYFTDNDGNYVLEDLEPGDYVVSATADGCEDKSNTYVYDGGDVEMDIALSCEVAA